MWFEGFEPPKSLGPIPGALSHPVHLIQGLQAIGQCVEDQSLWLWRHASTLLCLLHIAGPQGWWTHWVVEVDLEESMPWLLASTTCNNLHGTILRICNMIAICMYIYIYYYIVLCNMLTWNRSTDFNRSEVMSKESQTPYEQPRHQRASPRSRGGLPHPMQRRW